MPDGEQACSSPNRGSPRSCISVLPKIAASIPNALRAQGIKQLG
ncbi:MAG: hypothetical protein ACPGVY_05240 [Mycobacterium sp.]